jgi:hypothetical protein
MRLHLLNIDVDSGEEKSNHDSELEQASLGSDLCPSIARGAPPGPSEVSIPD